MTELIIPRRALAVLQRRLRPLPGAANESISCGIVNAQQNSIVSLTYIHLIKMDSELTGVEKLQRVRDYQNS